MDTKPGEKSATSKTKNTCKELQAIEPALWTFVSTAGVDPTNNRAERDLRHAVMIRKVSIGSQSEDGMEWMSRLLTVLMTTRAQASDVAAGIEAGADTYIIKPFGPIELREHVEALLERKPTG